jgi:hypothetical protein
MSDGACAMSDGACPMSDGACPMSDGACPMSDGACPMSDGACPMSDGACAMSDGACAMSDGACAMSKGGGAMSATSPADPRPHGGHRPGDPAALGAGRLETAPRRLARAHPRAWAGGAAGVAAAKSGRTHADPRGHGHREGAGRQGARLRAAPALQRDGRGVHRPRHRRLPCGQHVGPGGRHRAVSTTMARRRVGGWRWWGEVGTLWQWGSPCYGDRPKSFLACRFRANRRASSSTERSIVGGKDFGRPAYHQWNDFGTATYYGQAVFAIQWTTCWAGGRD